MATAEGRMLRKPIVSTNVYDGGVFINVNDERNPEFWCNIRLELDELRDLLDRAEQLTLRSEFELTNNDD